MIFMVRILVNRGNFIKVVNVCTVYVVSSVTDLSITAVNLVGEYLCASVMFPLALLDSDLVFIPCDAMRCTVLVIVILSVCLSVCPSVCRTRALCPHGSTTRS